MLTLSWMAFGALSLFVFLSLGLSSLYHLFVALPALFFFRKYTKEFSLQGLPGSFWALMALVVAIIFSVAMNWAHMESPVAGLLKIKYFVLGALGAFPLIFLKRDPSKLAHVLIITATLATLTGLGALALGVHPLRWSPPCHPERACGAFGHYMTYGQGISLFCSLLGATLFQRGPRPFPFKLGACCLAINLVGLYFSYTRGGWLAFLLSVPFFRQSRRFFLCSSLGVGLVAGGLFFGVSKVGQTFTQRGESDQIRLAQFQAALYALKERPLTGWGYRNFEPNSHRIKAKYGLPTSHWVGHAHNNFLEHLASTGILGGLFFLAFNVLWAVESFRFFPVMFPFVLNFSLSGLFQYTFGDGENLFLIMGAYALYLSQKLKNGRAIKESRA